MADFEIGNRNSRSSNQKCSVKQGVLGNFAKFTEKHLRQSLFFNKVARPATLLKKRLWRRCVPVNFCEISKNTFSAEHLRMTASETHFFTDSPYKKMTLSFKNFFS